jgi:spore coat protein A
VGDLIPLRPEETGWQDTVPVDPNTMMSIVATFDLPGEYVWHCHILSHEDNEMMRPFFVETASEPLLSPLQTSFERWHSAKHDDYLI